MAGQITIAIVLTKELDAKVIEDAREQTISHVWHPEHRSGTTARRRGMNGPPSSTQVGAEQRERP